MTTATLSTGEVVTLADIREGTCARCGARMFDFGSAEGWLHAEARLSNRYRHWMGGTFDHDATDDPSGPKRRRIERGGRCPYVLEAGGLQCSRPADHRGEHRP
jgi:hypothetical protein